MSLPSEMGSADVKDTTSFRMMLQGRMRAGSHWSPLQYILLEVVA